MTVALDFTPPFEPGIFDFLAVRAVDVAVGNASDVFGPDHGSSREDALSVADALN